MRSRGKFFLAVLLLALAQFYIGALAIAADREQIRPWNAELPVRGAWLRLHLPDSTLAYVRLPHPLGFLAAPKGNAMDNALRSTANVENLRKIQSALVENVLEYIPGFEQAYVRDFAEQLRSPVEFAMMLSPAPSILVSMNLDIESADAFEQMLSGISIGESPLALLSPLDVDGFGQVIGLPVPAAVHFDAGSGRMLLQTGPAVSADQFALMVASMSAAAAHRMNAMEQQVDSSGYGLFAWVDAESTIPAAQMFMNAEQLAKLEESGLREVRAVALGWGVANRKGRLSVIVDMPRDGKRQVLPYVRNEISVTTVGEPDAIIVLSVPTAEEFTRIEAIALTTASEESRNTWLDGKAALEEATGIRIENVLGALGPEVIAIFDEAGDYAAIRLRDARLFDDFVARVSAISGSPPEQRRYKRHTFYHWSLASEIETLDESAIEALGPLAFILAREREHLHWYRDGDFLYVANVPQPLIDRVDAGAGTSVADWLSERQNIDLSSSLFAATGTSRKLPRRIYHLYLEMLQAVADISEANFDIWSMPTASQVSIPDKGALGFSVNLGDPYLSMEFMFENNPLESVFSGDMTSVAALGVIAAIAIPAYQDYTIRANVSLGIADAGIAQAAVIEYRNTRGEYPGPTPAAEISDRASFAEHAANITVVPGTGVIVIRYSEEVLPAGGELYLEPVVGADGSVAWRCSATIEDKHLPVSCRGNVTPDLVQGGT